MAAPREVLEKKLDKANLDRLLALGNERLFAFVADAVELCGPRDVRIVDDSAEGAAETRRKAIEVGEETPLAIEGHTVHFDGPQDQGRDREVTRYLVPKGDTLSKALNQVGREEGLKEIRGLMKGAMNGRTMIVRFMSLGPTDSVFSTPCVECTDSYYVSHTLNLLYRRGYEEFKRLGAKADFLATLHSCGRLDERMASAETDKKRIYIDYSTNTVYSVNTQYAGNTAGLKKLALRLTIREADRGKWLAEHMFLMGVHGPKGRKTYFAGAFPSACGKTSTAMLPGETILGDDIAYLRRIDGECRAANAESGIFGIIQNVNAADDPAIWDVLTRPGEVIFSNVLIKDGKPYWLGMGQEPPASGENFSGPWHKGKKDSDGSEIPPAHKNARYAVALAALANCDKELDNPRGVAVGGIIYGGRDPEAQPPVLQSFDWEHGIVTFGACLETETTFAIIGQEGKREINVMSIQDFLSIPIGKYVQNNLDFAQGLKRPPVVFGVNYFLRDAAGKLVTGMHDKAVWVKWMELRVHGDVEAINGPTGWLPRYEDLQRLFREHRQEEFSRERYAAAFSIRCDKLLAKLDRAEKFHRQEPTTPKQLLDVLSAQRKRLEALRAAKGDVVSPFDL